MSDVLNPDPVVAGDGQVGSAPVTDGQGTIDPALTGGQVTPEPFYYDEHSKKSYATKEELDAAMRDSFMMQSSFTKKNQTHARTVADWEKQKAAEQARMDAREAEYQQFQRLMDERPDVYNEMKKRLDQGPTPAAQMDAVKAYIEKTYGPQFKEFESWKAQQETRQERNAAFAELAKKHTDFDSDAVDRAFEELTQAGILELAEMIHFSLKGRVDPVAMQQRIVDSLAAKKDAGLSAPPTASAGKGTVKIPASLEEAASMAYEKLGVDQQ